MFLFVLGFMHRVLRELFAYALDMTNIGREDSDTPSRSVHNVQALHARLG